MKSIAIGVDLGGTNLKALCVEQDGAILARTECPTNAEKGPDAVLQTIIRTVNQLIRDCDSASARIIGVGIGAPGPLNPETGVVLKAPNLPGWKNIQLRERVADALKMPIKIENDANLAALGEYWKGAGANASVLVCLTLGTGVGGGVIINGRIFSGSSFIGAELGHMSIKYDGLPCGCGGYGCLEAYISATSIIKRTTLALERGARSSLATIHNYDVSRLTAHDVYKAAVDGDDLARHIMEETGMLLGIGLANVGNIFNPDVVVIGGGVAGAFDILIEPARRELQKRAMPGIMDTMTIVPAQLGSDAGSIGAAGLFFM